MDSNLRGYALVTGAASGIGQAICIAYATAGLSGIALVDRDRTGLEATSKQCAAEAVDGTFRTLILEADVTKEAQVEKAVGDAFDTFGRIDYAVNCAGVSQETLRSVADTTTSEFDFVDSVNHRAMFLCLRAELQKMKTQDLREVYRGRPKERGAIVNIASAAGIAALWNQMVYCSTKHAVVGMSKVAATDHAADSIRINIVSPGYVDTPLISHRWAVPGLRKRVEGKALLNRLAKVDEIADAVMFLSSGRASFITGHNLVVDGGYTGFQVKL